MKLIRKFFINKTSLEEKINKNKFKVEIYTQFKKIIINWNYFTKGLIVFEID